MYQGQYYDAEIELAYNRFRYYDPEDGRYISTDPIGLLSGEFNFYSYVKDPNGWIDILGLAGSGGAYMFEFESGQKYIGKGEVARSNRSVVTQGKKRAVTNNKIAGKSTISTGGDNELGKMVEYQAMKKSGFVRGDIPAPYLNSAFSGETAWNDPKNSHLKKKASKLADQLISDFEEDKKKRKKTSYSK